MTPKEQIAAAKEPHHGIALSDRAEQRIAYNRLKEMGWEFDDVEGKDYVMVSKGGSWHKNGGVWCDCPYWFHHHTCTHSAGVTACGGVARAKEFINEDKETE